MGPNLRVTPETSGLAGIPSKGLCGHGHVVMLCHDVGGHGHQNLCHFRHSEVSDSVYAVVCAVL